SRKDLEQKKREKSRKRTQSGYGGPVRKNLNGRMEDRSVFNSANPGPYRRLLGVRGRQTYTLVSDVNADAASWPGCNFSFGGPHPGVCQFAMVDGSVRALRTSLTNSVLQALGERSDGKAISVDD